MSWLDKTWWEGEKHGEPAFLANNSIASSIASVEAYRKAVLSSRLIGYL